MCTYTAGNDLLKGSAIFMVVQLRLCIQQGSASMPHTSGGAGEWFTTYRTSGRGGLSGTIPVVCSIICECSCLECPAFLSHTGVLLPRLNLLGLAPHSLLKFLVHCFSIGTALAFVWRSADTSGSAGRHWRAGLQSAASLPTELWQFY